LRFLSLIITYDLQQGDEEDIEYLVEMMSIASFKSEEDVENPKEEVSGAITTFFFFFSFNSSHKKVFEC